MQGLWTPGVEETGLKSYDTWFQISADSGEDEALTIQ